MQGLSLLMFHAFVRHDSKDVFAVGKWYSLQDYLSSIKSKFLPLLQVDIIVRRQEI